MHNNRKAYRPPQPKNMSVYGPNIQRICVCADMPLGVAEERLGLAVVTTFNDKGDHDAMHVRASLGLKKRFHLGCCRALVQGNRVCSKAAMEWPFGRRRYIT